MMRKRKGTWRNRLIRSRKAKKNQTWKFWNWKKRKKFLFWLMRMRRKILGFSGKINLSSFLLILSRTGHLVFLDTFPLFCVPASCIVPSSIKPLWDWFTSLWWSWCSSFRLGNTLDPWNLSLEVIKNNIIVAYCMNLGMASSVVVGVGLSNWD